MSLPDLRYANNIVKAFGFIGEEEARLIFDLAVRACRTDAVFVNIGAGVGTSSLAMRAGCPQSIIYTVDICTGGPLGGLENERNVFGPTPLKLPNQILGDSSTIGKTWENEEIDFIFIDGDHTEEGLTKDIEAWFPHMKNGGIMGYHDYGHHFWPCVKLIVDRFMDSFTILGHERFTIAFEVSK